MKESWLTSAGLDELVATYSTAAEAHGLATEKGDHRKANRNADIIAKVYSELRKRGSREVLLPLLSHSAFGVRCWAGAHALEFAPAEGECVLLDLAKVKNSLIAFSASMTLEQWKKGGLKFP